MNKPYIQSVQKNLSIPWYEQITKEVIFPCEREPQLYYSIKPSDYVTALTHTLDNRFIILKQYRPAVEDYTYELPSGHLEDGESPDEAVRRELREETGCVADHVSLLGEVIPDTGRLENRFSSRFLMQVHRLEENRGQAAARNHGLARVRSDAVAFLDDDDLFPTTPTRN